MAGYLSPVYFYHLTQKQGLNQLTEAYGKVFLIIILLAVLVLIWEGMRYTEIGLDLNVRLRYLRILKYNPRVRSGFPLFPAV